MKPERPSLDKGTFLRHPEQWQRYREELAAEERRIREQLAWQFCQAERAKRQELDRLGLSHLTPASVTWAMLGMAGLVLLSVALFCLRHG